MSTGSPSLAAVAGVLTAVLHEGCSREYDDMVGWVVFGCILAFTTAMGIGANDVANSFATSVGTGTISLRQAVLIASLFEFLGAVLVGKGVTKTVKKKIIDPKNWKEDPEYLMLGMVSTLIGCSVWLAMATKWKMPVSTTHTVVGGLLGFAMFTKPEAIKMDKLTMIFVSWVTAPVMSGLFATFCFFLYRCLVLRKENSLEIARKSISLVVGLVFFVGFSFIFIKGPADLKKEMEDADNDGSKKEAEDRLIALAWAMLSSIVCTLPVVFLIVPKVYQKVLNQPLTDFPWHVPEPSEQARAERGSVELQSVKPNGDKVRAVSAGDAEIRVNAEEDVAAGVDHRRQIAEKFDERTEGLVSYLQVLSASFGSFAHGANDTANAIGPFAALWSLYRHGKMEDDVPIWIMIVGGAGLVIGLLFFGENIIKAIGTELVRITPSRGLFIEIASASVVIFCSALALPTSTTHCQVGATVGVGLLEGQTDSINGKMLLKVFFGWVITLVISGLTSGTLYLMLKEIVCAQMDHTHIVPAPVNGSNSSSL